MVRADRSGDQDNHDLDLIFAMRAFRLGPAWPAVMWTANSSPQPTCCTR